MSDRQSNAPSGTDPATTLEWPESTFTHETDPALHAHDARWEPFVDDPEVLYDYLAFIAPNSVVTRRTVTSPIEREEPAHWPKGRRRVHPDTTQGLAFVIEESEKTLETMFPFFATGTGCTLVLRSVTAWANGLEAQIHASWGPADVTFYDTEYVLNRSLYEAGKRYDFMLTGIAYSARPASDDEIGPKDDASNPDSLSKARLEGATVLLPGGGESADYLFRATLKSVTPFSDWLGQDGWRVCATAVRFDDAAADLEIAITKRAWKGSSPPQVGQDINGRLWLQGYLSAVR